jgi:hypothetical protein
MREKDFNKELYFFLDKIKNDEPFSLSRWGDGELIILENKHIDLRNTKNGEFRHDPNLKQYEKPRDLLLKSYKYVDDQYYVGIACKCCVGDKKYQYMKKLSGQNEDNLTWANIFVNSNYKNFIKDYSEVLKNKDVIIIANNQADVSKLPFNIIKSYSVGTDAWIENLDIIEQIKSDIIENKYTNVIFLFAAGPLANILTYELWRFDKTNTYIDIGSVYDVVMGMKPTRGYLNNAPTLQKICIW